MFSNFVLSRLSSFASLCHASTSARRFCLLGRNLTRFQHKEPLREQLRNALTKNKEAKEAPRADSIPPRTFRQVFVRGGLFFFVTSNVVFTIAAANDSERTQKRFQSLIDQTIYEFRRAFSLAPARDRHAESAKVIWALIGANVAIFLLWQMPIVQPFMWRYFTNGVASKSLCLPMLLSLFSHKHLVHMLLNMYVLSSFASGAIGFLGPSQFLAMYLSGGVFGSWLSLCHKALLASAIPSLGASGAICAAMGYICTKMPDTKVHIIFLPMFTFSAEYALYGFLAFELLCAFRIFPGSRFLPFDNFAHIGGLLIGMYYANNGEQLYRSIKPLSYTMSWQTIKNDGISSSQSKTVVYSNRSEDWHHGDEDALRAQQKEKERRKEMRRKFVEENEAQRKRQKDIEKRHKEWVEQMEEERVAVKERIRLNLQKSAQRGKSGADGESDDGEDNE